MAPLTLYLSLTSSPSSPRAPLVLEDGASSPVAPAELRRRAAAATSVPLASLKLIFRGRVIPNKEEGDVVKEFRLEEGSVVHVMGRPVAAPGAAATSAAASSSATGASVTLPSGGGAANAGGGGGGGGGPSPLDAALAGLRSSNDGAAYRTALATADKLLGNVVNNPLEEKYRTIKKSNPAFSRRLGSLPGGTDLLLAAGFVVDTNDGAEYYVLHPSEEAWPRLVAAREGARRALEEHDSSSRSSGTAAPPSVPGTAGAGGTGAGSSSDLLGGMSNMFPGGAGGGAPDMAAMQSMLSDPTMVQNVMNSLNNPMVQNMMRNDPRLANNPMLQQSLNALQSNPEMISQFSRMMSDPNVRERMSNIMSQQPPAAAGGGAGDPFSGGPEAMRRQMEQFQQMARQFGGSGGGFGAGGGGGGTSSTAGIAGQGGTSSGGAVGSNSANSGGGGAGSSDTEMTEEEMIAEAIRRSMAE